MPPAQSVRRRRTRLRSRLLVAVAVSCCALAPACVGVALADGGPHGDNGQGQGQSKSQGDGQGQGQGQGDGQSQGQGNGQGQGQGQGQGRGDGQGQGQGDGNGHGNGDGKTPKTAHAPGSASTTPTPTPTTTRVATTNQPVKAPVTVAAAPAALTPAAPTPAAPTPVAPTPVAPAPVTPVVTRAPTPSVKHREPHRRPPLAHRSAPVAAPVHRASSSAGTHRFANTANLLAARVALSSAVPAVTGPLRSTRQPLSAKRPPAPSPRVHQAAQLPVIRTITTIINVVPLPVRILLSLMALLALALAAHSRLAGVRVRRLDRQRRQLLDDVGLLQGTLLPVPPDRLGKVGTSVAYRPSDGLAAGGDFYDLFGLANGQVAVVLGDLSGHGRTALPHTALVRYTIRAYLESGMSPRGALHCAAPILERQLGESLATVVAATYDPQDRTLVYACAGHPPPVVIGSKARVPVTAGSSPPIGAALPTGMRQSTVSLPGQATVCFYTDGVVEARVGTELVGVQRLQRALADLGPTATAPALLDRIASESDARPDDMAACLLQVEGGSAAPVSLTEELELDSLDAADERSERFFAACGIPEPEIAGLMTAARAQIARNGSVVLEVHFDNGAPHVTLRNPDLTALQTA